MAQAVAGLDQDTRRPRLVDCPVMDMNHELAKFQLLLLGLVLFIVSTFMSCNEMRYAMWGTSVDTMTFSKQEVSTGRRRLSRKLLVKYTFDDAGKVRKEEDEVPLDLPFPAANMIAVEYIPGSESSRVLGHHQKWWLLVFAGSLGLMGFGAYKFWKFYKS